MELLGQIWITLLVLVMVYCFYGLYKNTLEIKKLNKEIVRNQKVYNYRIDLLKRLNVEDYKKLPSYDDMMKSNKPLEDMYWLNAT